MKVTLFDIISPKKGCVNKDLAGGFGTRTYIGNGWRAKLLEYAKKNSVRIPQLTTAYIAAIFNKAGWNIELKIVPPKHDLIDASDSDLLLIQSSIVDCQNEIKTAQSLKRKKGSLLGFYGAFATVKPEIFSNYCNFVINGEPEDAIKRIARGEKPTPLMKSRYLSAEELNNLPFPYWSIFPIKKFSYKPSLLKTPVLTILSSRGCPQSCGFYCPYVNFQGNFWRARSTNNIIAEIEYLIANYKIKALDFRDPTFTMNMARAAELAQKMIDKKFNLEWSCETRLDLLDKKLLDLMFESGLRNINVGVESANYEVLKSAKRKPIAIEHQEKVINYCKKKGIRVAAFYILGLESDTAKTVLNTIEYAKKLNTNIAQFTISTPYPGNGFYEQVKNEIYENDWENFDSYTPVMKHPNLSREELLRLKEKAWGEYYFRPKWLWQYFINKI